ncbi:SMP-30/gluconolactonase/LRE family protein [candidate division CSSED10-310 bacterium]|uniref:SMP-30/gluconolactonase/LRE family protein n=1 Tax=candidate division CSSED10-310 bacterium TaxID=2855610 RepID=A0ABV6Z0U9_UNCC1
MQKIKIQMGINVIFIILLVSMSCCQRNDSDEPDPVEIQFPVTPSELVQGKFNRCEGIAFNGEDDLYVSGDRSLWRVDTQGEVTRIADAYSNLGLAPVGDRDILFADFGPTNAFDHGANRDGIVWRITPEGDKSVAASGMGDPNFILVLENGSFLVSDDATDEVFIVDEDGSVEIFTQLINHPNGMVLSMDGTRLYIAQMFKSINPIVTDGRLWALELENNAVIGDPEMVANLGDSAANDGLAMDIRGRIYIAAWGTGQIWRLEPLTSELVLIAENMPGVASLAFGQGDFDHRAIYATSTLRGIVWRIDVGIEGAPLFH